MDRYVPCMHKGYKQSLDVYFEVHMLHDNFLPDLLK